MFDIEEESWFEFCLFNKYIHIALGAIAAIVLIILYREDLAIGEFILTLSIPVVALIGVIIGGMVIHWNKYKKFLDK